MSITPREASLKVRPLHQNPIAHKRLQALERASRQPLDQLDPSAHFALARAVRSGFHQQLALACHRHRLQPWALSASELPAHWWFRPRHVELVFTGFGPFRTHRYNPSTTFARVAAAESSHRFGARFQGLDVTFAATARFVDTFGHSSQPIFIHCGLAADRDQFCLERYAHNVCGPEPGIDELSPDTSWILPGGPPALETLLPVDDLATELDATLRADGLPGCSVSRDAGTYICNSLYYRSLAWVAAKRAEGDAAESIFLHMPALPAEESGRAATRFALVLGDWLDSMLHPSSGATPS